jgi:hypothetical protein
MQLRCGSCDQVVETPGGWNGGPFNCPACDCLIELTDAPAPVAAAPAAPGPAEPDHGPAPAPAPEPEPEPEPTKNCPFCGEAILKIARKCKHCKEDLSDVPDLDAVRERFRAKEQQLASQLAGDGLPSIPWTVGGRIRLMSVLLLGIAGLGLLAAVVGFSVEETSELFALGPLGAMVSIIVGLIALISLARDLMVPSAMSRTTPLRGAKAFIRAVCDKRYRYAYACLLDADKDGLVRKRPALLDMGVKSGGFEFSSYRGFRDYWKGLLHHRGCTATASRFKVVEATDRFAVVSATINLNRSSGLGFLLLGILGAMLMAKKETLSVSKLLREADGQWCVVNGELDSAEDRAMGVAMELSSGA